MININDPTGSAIIEVLPAKDWACLLGKTDQAVRKAVKQPGGGYIARYHHRCTVCLYRL